MRAMNPIFVVEDDMDIRASIAEVLRDEGYDVEEYEDGERALGAILEGKRPSLVLIDLLMPIMSGEKFTLELRANAEVCATPIVLITGAGAHPPGIEVLRKPFELEDLLRVVGRHCGRQPSSWGDDRKGGLAAQSEAG